MRVLITCLGFLFCCEAYSQDTSKVFIHLVQPFKENNNVRSAKQNIIGSTCKNCTVTINQKDIKVYLTGFLPIKNDKKLIYTAHCAGVRINT